MSLSKEGSEVSSHPGRAGLGAIVVDIADSRTFLAKYTTLP
jgi:hypothetical protein